MFQILFVDADTTIQQFVRKINWSQYQIENHFWANGLKQGIELAERYRPDIIVTELHFPDGFAIDMIRKIQSFHPQFRFLIYTYQAYGEELIEAMKLGCFRCVIKHLPWIHMQNLVGEIDELIQRMQTRLEQANSYREMQCQMEQYSCQAQRAYLNCLSLDESLGNIHQTISCLNDLHLPFKSGSYLVHINDFPPKEVYGAEIDYKALLHRCVKTWLKDSRGFTIYLTPDNQQVIIVHDVEAPQSVTPIGAYKTAEQFNREFFEHYHLKIYAGQSCVFSSWDEYPQAFLLAQQTARYAVLHDRNVVSFAELKTNKNVYNTIRNMLRYFICYLQTDCPVTDILEHILLTLRCLRVSAEGLQLAAIDFLVESNRAHPTAYPHWYYFRNEILQIRDIEGFHLWISRLIADLKPPSKDNGSTNQQIILQAKLYIKSHYFEKLTLPEVANQVSISPSYLSSMFHKYEGVKLSEYLLLCRIEEAKRLLKRTQLKIDRIAEKVGFPNVKYFPTCFKHKTGLTPSAYRNQYRNAIPPTIK